jgi:hypothetical protein
MKRHKWSTHCGKLNLRDMSGHGMTRSEYLMVELEFCDIKVFINLPTTMNP